LKEDRALTQKSNIPEHELEAIARCVYPAIVEFFQSEEGKKEFAEWKAQQQAEQTAAA